MGKRYRGFVLDCPGTTQRRDRVTVPQQNKHSKRFLGMHQTQGAVLKKEQYHRFGGGSVLDKVAQTTNPLAFS